MELAGQAGGLPWPDTAVVGGWWNRQHNPEVDLVGADCAPVAGRIDFAGSIKWIGSTFDRHDLESLRHSVDHIPGYDHERFGLAVVSLSGTDIGTGEVDLVWGPDDAIRCWTADWNNLNRVRRRSGKPTASLRMWLPGAAGHGRDAAEAVVRQIPADR